MSSWKDPDIRDLIDPIKFLSQYEYEKRKYKEPIKEIRFEIDQMMIARFSSPRQLLDLLEHMKIDINKNFEWLQDSSYRIKFRQRSDAKSVSRRNFQDAVLNLYSKFNGGFYAPEPSPFRYRSEKFGDVDNGPIPKPPKPKPTLEFFTDEDISAL